jgi:hypothetical protein
VAAGVCESAGWSVVGCVAAAVSSAKAGKLNAQKKTAKGIGRIMIERLGKLG